MRKKFTLSFLIVLALLLIQGCVQEQISYEDFFEKELKEAKAKNVKKENLPFVFITEGNKAVLLIHGLTATPWEVKELGIYLAQKNITTYAPLLEGHGTTPYNLELVSWQSWYKDVKEAYNILSQNNDYVYVIGVSTGANLALLLSADTDFSGVVAIGAPIWLKDKRTEFVWLYKHLPSYRYIEREIEEERKDYYYELLPSQSVYELTKLVLKVRGNLGRVDEPILIIQSTEDQTVNPKSAEYIYEHVGSFNKTLSWKEKAPHVILEENKNEIFNEVYNFISEH